MDARLNAWLLATGGTGVKKIMDQVATNTTSTPVKDVPFFHSLQAVLTGTGAISATVTFEASINGINYSPIYLAELDGTTSAAALDGSISNMGTYPFMRCTVTELTGTNAKVDAYIFA